MDTVGDPGMNPRRPRLIADLGLMLRVALADYVHERRLSLPLALSLAAVLAPLLVLFGLKFGIISTMSRALTEDPRSRELRPLGQGRFDQAWLAELAARPEVAFLLPNTRFLAATMTLRNREERSVEPVHVELTPSAPGDPLLQGSNAEPDGFTGLILSSPAAESLKVEVGDRIEGRLGRTLANGDREVLRFELNVDEVLAPAVSGRVEALVALPFLLGSEDYREGFGVASFQAAGPERPPGERHYAGFRLYAGDIFQVASLREWLAQRDVMTDTRIGEIELIQRLDRSLTILYLIIAGLGGSGFLVSLTVSLWATTERKRRELSILRLLGLRSKILLLLPALQATLTALIGSVAAIAIYVVVENLINALFRDSLAEQQVLSQLEPHHLLAAAGVTLLFSLAASLAAAVRAAGVSPSEGLRDE